MSAESIYPFQMDLMYSASNDPIKIIQNDYKEVIFNVSVTSNDEPVDITGATATITILRPDNKVSVHECIINNYTGGLLEYCLTSSDTCVSGTCSFTVEIHTEGGRVSTQKAKFTVINELGGDNAVIAEDNYPILDELIKEVQAIQANETSLYCMAGVGGIPIYKVVYLSDYDTALSADCSNITHFRKILGITTETKREGEQIQVKTIGKIVNTSWNLTPGNAYYVGHGGDITDTPPTVGFIQQVGMAKNINTLIIKLGLPIKL